MVNPDQIDVLNSIDRVRRHDLPLSAKLWYRAQPGSGERRPFHGILRDGQRQIRLHGAAPHPAPVEGWKPSPHLDFHPCEHYADPVWDTLAMNNIAQHFALAFLDRHLKADQDRDAWLTADFKGFPPGSAQGLTWERLNPA